jgi:hypothetical protein
MKKSIFAFTMLTLCLAISAAAQAPGKGIAVRFSGVSEFHMGILLEAKKITAIPLPTWIPPGFKMTDVKVHLGSEVALQNRVLTIIYSKKFANGKVQRFALDAGFDGLGGLPYDVTKVIPSGVGNIDLMYEPNDEDGKIKNYVMTEWFKVGKTDFHYDGMYGNEPEHPSLTMISLEETEKILRSLRRL